MCKVEANTRAAEIICEAKQAIENFKNGTVETVSMDTFLQELVCLSPRFAIQSLIRLCICRVSLHTPFGISY